MVKFVMWVITMLVFSLALALEAQSSPSIEGVTDWLASKIKSNSMRDTDMGPQHTTVKLSLKRSGQCEITFEEIVRTSNNSPGHSIIEITTVSTIIPLSQISANSLELIENRDNFSSVGFNAAKDMPYHVKISRQKTATGEDPNQSEEEHSVDSFTFQIKGASLAARMGRAIRYLAEQCNAENEPF